MPRSSNKTPEDRHALVKWTEGVHAGMYTHNVALDWIHDFDATSPRYPETYAIDWRVPPKPRSGWPVIEGLVLDISSDLEYLKSKADQLTKKDQQRLNSSGRNDNEDAGSSSSERDSNLMDVNSEAFIALVARLSKSHANQSTGSSSSSRSSSFSNRSCSNESTSPPPQQKVSVGKSLCVDKTVYTLALNAGSPGRMVRPLLRQAFSRRRLIASTYAGQKRMVDGNLRVKPSLKKYQKMADIHSFVLRKYPYLSQSNFGAIVNSFLGEKPNAIQNIEYVEDSSESESE